MGEGDNGHGKDACVRTLEPLAGRERTGQPLSYRIRRVAEPAPKQPSRLLFLPPVWTRASFWLPLRDVAMPPRPSASSDPGPRDDFAA